MPVDENQSLSQHGTLLKSNPGSCCQKYYVKKNNSRMTPFLYRNGVSMRLLVSKETFMKKRSKLPILIINIDGALGYFDESKVYTFKDRSLQHLHSLSHNFRIVGFSQENKSLVRRLCKQLTEYSRPFCFDAVYLLHRKSTSVNVPRTNLSQILLDFSSPDEEDMDLFMCSSVVLVTADRAHFRETFETMDLREIYDFDKDYLKGEKAPLIIRLPHARLRPNSSLCFDAVFQTLVTLLVTSKLKNFETSSFFSYNDRTKNMNVPSQEKGICPFLLPEKIKTIEKQIVNTKS
jgi:hypothetical protein